MGDTDRAVPSCIHKATRQIDIIISYLFIFGYLSSHTLPYNIHLEQRQQTLHGRLDGHAPNYLAPVNQQPRPEDHEDHPIYSSLHNAQLSVSSRKLPETLRSYLG